MEQAVKAHKHRIGNEGLSLKVLQEHARENEKLKTSLDRLLSLPAIPPEYLEYLEKDREHIEEQKRQEQQWLDDLRSNVAALRENRAAPALLYRMAQEYFGNMVNVDDGPNAIEELLQGTTVN